MVLAGLTPDVVMDIATRALSFYSFQVNYELRQQALTLADKTQTIANQEAVIQSMNSQGQVELSRQQHLVQGLEYWSLWLAFRPSSYVNLRYAQSPSTRAAGHANRDAGFARALGGKESSVPSPADSLRCQPPKARALGCAATR
eukprot:m.124572 g.124572  ORF g.124572 m.124572 type:complete len:144 (-) comp52185_c0_seq10:434-865(-)